MFVMGTVLARYIVVLALLSCNLLLAAENPKTPGPGDAKHKTGQKAEPEKLDVPELIDWLLRDGKDYMIPEDTHFELLNLPPEDIPAKLRGAVKMNLGQSVRLALQPRSGPDPGKPDCLLFLWQKEYLEQRTVKTYAFRFSLDGKLERALSSVGKLHPDGKSVRALGVNTALDIDDPEIQERAQAELDFWLVRAAGLIAKKKAESRKQTSAPASAASDSRASHSAPAARPVSRKP
jgi:hypothetical protein